MCYYHFSTNLSTSTACWKMQFVINQPMTQALAPPSMFSLPATSTLATHFHSCRVHFTQLCGFANVFPSVPSALNPSLCCLKLTTLSGPLPHKVLSSASEFRCSGPTTPSSLQMKHNESLMTNWPTWHYGIFLIFYHFL